jgi:hypothetical protein
VGDESNVQVTYAMADALSRAMRSERTERMILAVLDMLARGVLEVEHPAVATAITHYAPLRPYALGLVLKTMKEAIARGWLTSYASLVRVRQAQGEQATVAEVWLEDLLQELRWFGGAEDEYGLAIPAEEKPLARLRPVKLPPDTEWRLRALSRSFCATVPDAERQTVLGRGSGHSRPQIVAEHEKRFALPPGVASNDWRTVRERIRKRDLQGK